MTCNKTMKEKGDKVGQREKGERAGRREARALMHKAPPRKIRQMDGWCVTQVKGERRGEKIDKESRCSDIGYER
jgi:hypothetical protein